jgi:hypothetical protein
MVTDFLEFVNVFAKKDSLSAAGSVPTLSLLAPAERAVPSRRTADGNEPVKCTQHQNKVV